MKHVPVVFYLLIAITGIMGCNNVFLFPMKETWDETKKIPHEEVYFSSSDGVKLHGWFLEGKSKESPPILFLHGNAENLSTHVLATLWLVESGYSVFIFDYRGYGRSSGKADLDGSFLDARAALEWLHERKNRPIVVFGQSLGAAISLAAFEDEKFRSRICGMVLEAPFASYRRIAREKLGAFFITWPLQYPLSLLISDEHAPETIASSFGSLPTVVVHSTQDPVVGYHHGEAVAKALGAPLWSTSRPSHGDAFRSVPLQQKLIEFISSACGQTNFSVK